MALDLRGSLKKARFNDNYYIFIDEIFANAIDSFLIRQDQTKDTLSFEFDVEIDLYDSNEESDVQGFNMICRDNGIGLGELQTKAFVTKDTSYKDDLNIKGIGKCKGSGRIQYFQYFLNVGITSVFEVDKSLRRKKIDIDHNYKEIDENSFETIDVEDGKVGLEIKLKTLKDKALANIHRYTTSKKAFSAKSLKKHILIRFLPRLVSLKEQLGEFQLNFKSTYKKQKETSSIIPDDLPNVTSTETVKIDFSGSEYNEEAEFIISHYQLSKEEYNLTKNTVALCAKSAIVSDITNKFLKNKTLENNELDGMYHIIFVESPFLDENVNEQRDGYDIPLKKSSSADSHLLDVAISLEEIYDGIEDPVIGMLSPPDWTREDVVKRLGTKYGISQSILTDSKIRIKTGDSEDDVIKRVLSSYQETIIKDTSDIFDLKSEILSLEPDSEDFRDKVNELAWKHTSSLKSVDMANLSQIVVRRSAIIDILALAVDQKLTCQIEHTGRNKDEALVHSIFFPMKKDSSEVADHDVWILNEEYHYYDYIASDIPLTSYKWDDTDTLFDSDIDDELAKLLEKNDEKNKLKRPDIAIFSKEGAAIIVEFKAPGVSMDKHLGDLMEYAQLLAAKSKGRLKQFYGYLVGTELNPNRLRGYKRFSSGKGYFGTEEIIEHTTGARLGELYSEILYYSDIVDRASTRLEVYQNKLGLKLD